MRVDEDEDDAFDEDPENPDPYDMDDDADEWSEEDIPARPMAGWKVLVVIALLLILSGVIFIRWL